MKKIFTITFCVIALFFILTKIGLADENSTSTSSQSLVGTWYEDNLHERSRLRDYVYRLDDTQVSVTDKKHNNAEVFFDYKISGDDIIITSKGQTSSKISAGKFPVTIENENYFTIHFPTPLSFVRNSYAKEQAIDATKKAVKVAVAGYAAAIVGAVGEKAIASTGVASTSKASASVINTRNEQYEGKKHPETNVPYKRKTVKESDGKSVTGVFPQFNAKYEAQLPKNLYKASDKKQFAECNRQLKESVEKSPKIAKKFTQEQLEQIKNGDTPDGYLWHHNEEIGIMQLVDFDIHAKTGHTGGKNIWGGGSENR